MRNLNLMKRALVTLALVIAWPSSAVAAQPLFVATEPGFKMNEVMPDLAKDKSVVNAQFIRVDLKLLTPPETVFEKAPFASTDVSVELPLFERKVAVLLDQVAVLRPRTTAESVKWFGRVKEDPGSSVIIAVVNRTITASIRTRLEYYLIRPVRDNIHALLKIDPRVLPPEGKPIPVPEKREQKTKGLPPIAADSCPDTPIELLVVFTPKALKAAGGESAMIGLIDVAIAETNEAYRLSDVRQRIHLAGISATQYSEGKGLRVDLERLRGTADGYMDEIHLLRGKLQSDLVSLIVEMPDGDCGLGYEMTEVNADFRKSAFSVVPRRCITPRYSLAHELGHNMGSLHDHDTAASEGAPDNELPYAYGYVNKSQKFRDIMSSDYACRDCVRVQRFSNPRVSYNGFALGVDYKEDPKRAADVARTFNETRCTVVQFRR